MKCKHFNWLSFCVLCSEGYTASRCVTWRVLICSILFWIRAGLFVVHWLLYLVIIRINLLIKLLKSKLHFYLKFTWQPSQYKNLGKGGIMTVNGCFKNNFIHQIEINFISIQINIDFKAIIYTIHWITWILH